MSLGSGPDGTAAVRRHPSGTLDGVTRPAPDTAYEVTCPHCRKPFVAQLLGGPGTARQGFKCPHCRLFVPYDRADDQDLVEPAQD